MKKLVGVFLLFSVLLVACGGSEPVAVVDDSPSVTFTKPADGETVASPVKFIMSASNFKIEPAGEVVDGSGHFHILIGHDCMEVGEIIPGDEGYNHFGKGQFDAEIELEPGEYTACLQVGDGIHSATDLTDVITFNVE